jgi:hypothetical protein
MPNRYELAQWLAEHCRWWPRRTYEEWCALFIATPSDRHANSHTDEGSKARRYELARWVTPTHGER